MQPTISEFTIIFSIATLGMVVLAMAIVFFVLFYQRKMLEAKIKQQKIEVEHQQKMLQAALESQENERKRLAADLHDSIGVMLSTIRLSLGTLVRNEGVPAQPVEQIKNMLDDTITSVRRLSRDLLPSTLARFGLSNALKELCGQHSLSGISIQFSEKGTPRDKNQSDQLMIFRVAQELVNNAMKHAKPTSINVVLDWERNFELIVTDDGSGFQVEQVRQSGKGLGLFNLENRARLLNAQLSFSPNQPKGTIAKLEIVSAS
ncbi:MAG TPA: ATP-binding protein [Cyclobacteriaceae bacterium]|nr:ATP-binding protein [Cyclobacteriaceae bacterium]